MFTIKHINHAGDEFLIEAKQFLREQRSDPFVQYLAFDNDRHDYTASWCGDERREKVQGLEFRHTIYVMNRFGATVATHTFTDPDFGQVCEGPMQVEPASAQVA